MMKRIKLYLLVLVILLSVVAAIALFKKNSHSANVSAPPAVADHTTSLPAPPHGDAARAKSECPYTYVSWNIANFGISKKSSRGAEEIAFIASVVKQADIIAVQEVTAGKGEGARAIAQLADALSRTGADWDYIVSDATEPASTGVERYAYLWKKSIVSTDRGSAHLVQELREPIDREPYTITFRLKGGDDLGAFTIHTVPTAKHPEAEVRALGAAKELSAQKRAIVSGDFNLGPEVTDPLMSPAGYTGHIKELTSIKMKLDGERHLAKQYDNIYTKGVHVCTSGTIDFVTGSFSPLTPESLKRARVISDHLPVYATFK